MFSHAFEKIGKQLNLPLARHETVSEQLIRDSEITDVFRELGGGYADDVANVIQAGKPGNLYDSVVSSQFDADRLDYMQRDRKMTGVESSGIDATWLLANLEVASVRTGADADAVGSVKTLVLGPKSFHAMRRAIEDAGLRLVFSQSGQSVGISTAASVQSSHQETGTEQRDDK
jgi:hypothetical protein